MITFHISRVIIRDKTIKLAIKCIIVSIKLMIMMLKVYDPIHLSKWSFGMVSEESPYFSYHPCKILRPRDFDFKSYKRKCSESSDIVVTTIITIYELSLRCRL